MVEGISHLTFMVKDLELATKFFKQIFAAQEVYSSGGHTFSLAPERLKNSLLSAVNGLPLWQENLSPRGHTTMLPSKYLRLISKNMNHGSGSWAWILSRRDLAWKVKAGHCIFMTLIIICSKYIPEPYLNA